MSNNYTPRRAAPSGEPERRRGSSQSGYASERRVPRETGYTPRVPRETGYSSQPRTASRQSGYNPPRQGSASYETRPLRTTQPRDSVPRTSREPRPLRETGRETSTYVRRPAPSRRRRKSGPPILPLVLLLILLSAGVVRERHIGRASHFLMANMAFFFIPSFVGTLEHLELIRRQLLPLLVIVGLTTPLVYLAAGWTVQLLMAKKKKKGGTHRD